MNVCTWILAKNLIKKPSTQLRVSCHILRQKGNNCDEKCTCRKVGEEARGPGDSLRDSSHPVNECCLLIGQKQMYIFLPNWWSAGPRSVTCVLIQSLSKRNIFLASSSSVWQSNQESYPQEVDRKSSFWFDWLF